MKLVYITAALLLGSSSVTVRADELHEAITQINVERVKDILDKKEHLDHDEKKRLERFAHAVAKDAKYKTKSIWRSGEDMGRFVGGHALMIGGSLASLCLLSQKMDDPAIQVASLALFIATVWAGNNQRSKGQHLYAARQWHKKARHIESLIAEKHAHHHHN